MKPVEPPGAHTERILKARIAELEAEVARQTVVLAEYRLVQSSDRGRIAELETENESLEGLLLRQEARIAELEAKLAALDAGADDRYNEDLRQAKERIAELEAENADLLGHIAHDVKRIAELEALIRSREMNEPRLAAQRLDAALESEAEFLDDRAENGG